MPKLGPKAFEQCAGFLRIRGGSNPLDATAVHPESYAAAGRLLEKLQISADQLRTGSVPVKVKNYKAMAEELGIGEPTLRDIVKELQRPGRDPREDMPKPILRSEIAEILSNLLWEAELLV